MRWTRHTVLLAIAVLTAGLAGCRDRGTVSAAPPSSTSTGTAAARENALSRARVWTAPHVAPAEADFSVNAAGPGAFDARADVDCTFVLKTSSGTTPKFTCAMPDGTEIKVKYGAPNGELPAEVAATRLLRALGFPVDRMDRVNSVRCRGCPLLPHQALQCVEKGQPAAVCLHGANAATVITFAPAVIEHPIDGRKIDAEDVKGWSWYELEKIDAKSGGASRAQVDALRLVAVLLAHWDNKGPNQKLLCPPGADLPDGGCRSPIAAIGDLGGTFGPTKVNLTNWRDVPIWTDARRCRVSLKALPFDGGTFPDHEISEAGRQFVLTLLRPLTREQLDTLFTASGVTSFPHVLAEARQSRAWTDAFLDKVRQIETAGPCAQ